MLDVNWTKLDSDLTGFPASHAAWDGHGPAAVRSEPRFDSPPQLGLGSPPETSVSSRCRPQRHQVFKFDRPGPCPAGSRPSTGRNRRFVCKGTYALTAPPRSSETHVHRWPHLGVNGQPLNSPPVPKTNTDGGKSANTKPAKSTAPSHALTLLFRNPALTSCCAPFHPP